MKNTNFYLRAACFLIILAAVWFYNEYKSREQMNAQLQVLSERTTALELQQEEILTALTSRYAQSQTGQTAEDGTGAYYYQDGTFTGDGTGFGGNIEVSVTLEKDTLTDITIVSASGEDSAYISQAKGVITSVLSQQSTDVDTISGATFSSVGILNAIDDALTKAVAE
jgi:uncharacterized protein with FMN-binding domain